MGNLIPRLSNSCLLPDTKSHLRDSFFAPFEESFNSFFDDFFSSGKKPISHGFPRVDIYEHNNKFIVEYSIAGVKPEDISVELIDQEDGKHLKVSGKMSVDYEHKSGAHYHVKELSRKHFTRTMILPKHLIGDPEACYAHGMLTLAWQLEKEKEPQPTVKSIPVQIKDKKSPS